MKPGNETMMGFYQMLGKVFYGVAKVDGEVRETELQRLKEFVEKNWIPLEDTYDEFETDTAFQIEIVFNWLEENDFEELNTLQELEEYIAEHPRLLDKQKKQLIYETAEQIAEEFHGINKAEQTFLKKLGQLLRP
ncbi:tellurite resistance TerB family protein [Jiulongibacter sp. NS-SX5]|uniref:tellurite resistance TerB family protein n=1 Tax=Jiulongibacter sp. NS-SX5 TaxID=3463854 RepID=UPI0040585B1E